MKLHLGVVDQPYSNGGVSTGDVAGFLEEKYHVMEIFYTIHEQEVVDFLVSSVSGQTENLMLGAPIPNQPFLEGASKIEDAFRKFLDAGEMETLGIPGVPTQAALDRASSRFKKGSGPTRRPSFIDTGLYEASFKAWID